MVNLHFVAGLRFYCRKVLVSGFNGSYSQLKKKKKRNHRCSSIETVLLHIVYMRVNLYFLISLKFLSECIGIR